MKSIIIAGGTGTIGDNALSLIRRYPDDYRLAGFSAHQNIKKAASIIAEFQPEFVAVPDESRAASLRELLSEPCEVLTGETAIDEMVIRPCDLVVAAIVGMAGLSSTVEAVRAGQTIALANKESLVAAGHIVMPLVAQCGARLIPVDSEHNAIHQCLQGHDRSEVTKITLTASGGPFLRHTMAELAEVTRQDALAHPNWVMGAKISIDSATMMNKGLELIEAAHLFSATAEELDAIIHPQSLMHGMVDFIDGSVIAHLATADMKLPLAYAFGDTKRLVSGVSALDLVTQGQLEFLSIDEEKFKSYKLAKQVIDAEAKSGVILNAANEVAVMAFLQDKIGFLAIADLVDQALNTHFDGEAASLEAVFDLDCAVREFTTKQL